MYCYLSVSESSGYKAAETQKGKAAKPHYKNQLLLKTRETKTVKEREILTKFVQGL